MSRLDQLGRLRSALTPRDHVRVRVEPGRVAPLRLDLDARALSLKGRLNVGAGGEVVAVDEESAETLLKLSSELERLVGRELVSALEARSTLRWEAFMGHCVQWWLSQPQRAGFLKALAERLEDHAIELEVAWAEGVTVERTVAPPSELPLYIGGLLGLAVSQGAWWAPWPISITLGLAVGWLARSPRWRCTSLGCGTLMSTPYAQCPHCGATLKAPRVIEVPRER